MESEGEFDGIFLHKVKQVEQDKAGKNWEM